MFTNDTPVVTDHGAWADDLGIPPRRQVERGGDGVRSLAEQLDSRAARGRVIGESAPWQGVLKKATQVAATETTVLLQGDSGTGKEVVARFIHRTSPRKNGPFVAINCAALPEQLLESKLFGHERGAFTGALQPKPGQIEVASGGVLFLDEVGEMSPPAQAKLLRVLQEREFQRLGATRTLKANVRVVAATNRDLRKAVERGAFREDLYYRLHVFEIRIPPLRERKADLPLFADAFLKDIGRSLVSPPAGLADEAKAALFAHDWPGNVRELRNVLERAAILCEGGLITTEHLSLYSPPPATSPSTTNLGTLERQTIEQVLLDTRWNKVLAAKRLGLTRTQLYGRLRKYDLARAGPR
jgi:transcriptional regulator with GAF, ATPase, and Fis domain